MEYAVIQDGERFMVEAIDFDGDGEIYSALFIGPDAESRAREYAEWKTSPPSLGVKWFKWLCRLGRHSWREVGYTNLVLSDSLYRCSRCGAGRCEFQYGSAYIMYTPEQMDQMANQRPQ